jgi:hypothetical protein
MTEPKSIQDALRRLDAMTAAIDHDLEVYLDTPEDFEAPAFFEDVLLASNKVRSLVAWIRSDMMGVQV